MTNEPKIIVLDRNLSGGKKSATTEKTYTRSLKDVQVFSENIGDAAVDAADAVSKGVRRFRSALDSAARRRKDGALVELLPSMGKGLSETLKAGSEVPTQIGEALDTKLTRRLIKQALRILPL
jgi:hypothetical protein